MAVDLVPLTDHLFLVSGENQGRFPRSHSFYVRDDACAVIDTGCGVAVLEALAASHPIDFVINSHGHPDHSAGNWVLSDRPLFAPLAGADSHGQLVPLSHRFAEPGPLARAWREYIVPATDFRDRAPTDLYVDGQVFDFGHQKLTVMATPGHTADHCCLLDHDHGVVLCFDLDLTSFGPWYGHRESDLGALRRSVDAVAGLQASILASSHHPPLAGEAAAAALAAWIGVVELRSRRLVELIGEGATLEQLVDASPIYGGYPYARQMLSYWERMMIEQHLAELLASGTIARGDDGRYAVC